MSWSRIEGFRIVTADPDRLSRFYAAIGFAVHPPEAIVADEMRRLGLTGRAERRRMTVGASRVDLDTFEDRGRPYPDGADAASLVFQHLAIVTSDAATAWSLAEAAGVVPISTERPVTLPPSSGGVTAVKFRDPDGHPLEFLQFPDAAAMGWAGTGVLGIDHSAISVSDVEASVRFYVDRGLMRGDATLNEGLAQAALDDLRAPVADVVPMHPSEKKPHLELLGYHYPRPAGGETLRPADIAATRIVWRASEPGLARDPDGHLHELVAHD